jgi:neutral ceramidase
MARIGRLLLTVMGCWTFCMFLVPSIAHGDALKAGVARTDITPPTGTNMWGFGARKAPSIGIEDPLFAKVLVLHAGAESVAIITLDLGRSFGPTSLIRLHEMVKKSTGISDLLIAASHTHSGPVVSDSYTSGQPPEWEREALDKIAGAVTLANNRLVPVRVGTGYGTTYIGYNRLQTKLDSGAQFTNDRTKIISSPIDPTVAVLRIDTTDGNPLAILVNYACHPVVFGAENLKFSADYPGAMARTIEESFPSHPLAFFLQGGSGDIDPYYANTPLLQDPSRWNNWTGEHLGDEAVLVAKSIQTQDNPDASLDFSEETLPVHFRWDPKKFDTSFRTVFDSAQLSDYYPQVQPEIPLVTVTLLINKHIAFMSVPGEPFVELQMAWRNLCPVRDSFFVGYSNGYNGYFPTIQAATRQGYGATSAMTWVEVGSGEYLMNRALIRIYEMMGKLTDGPN